MKKSDPARISIICNRNKLERKGFKYNNITCYFNSDSIIIYWMLDKTAHTVTEITIKKLNSP